MTHLFQILCLLLASTAGSEPPVQGEAPPPPTIITGTLVSARDLEPVAGGRVFAVLNRDPETRREMMLAGTRLDEPIAESAAGKDGRFRLAVPPALQIILVAEAPDHARIRLEKAYFTGEAALQIEAGRIDLKPGRSLSGKVVSGNKPVAGATVIAIRERTPAASHRRRDPTSPYMITGTTDDKGAFELSGLPRKPVTVRIFADGRAPGIARGAGMSSGLDVILGAGVEVEGKVVGPDGKTPVEGAWVVVNEDGWDGIALTKPDGTFRLGNLRPGSITLRAIAAGTGPARAAAPRTPIPSPSSPVSLIVPVAQGSPPPVLRLRPGGVVVARTVDIVTRRPVAGARLSMGYPSQVRRLEAVTGSDGQIVYRGVPAERIGLYAEADDYLEENTDPRPLTAGETQMMSIAMRPAGAVEGIVRDDSGRPLSGAWVSVRGRSRMELPVPTAVFTSIGVDPVVSDLKGMFSLEKLPPGEELKIGVTLGGYAPWEMDGVEVRPFERRRGLEVILDRGAALTGRLETIDGVPITVAEIEASKDPGGESTAAVMREDAQNGSLPAVSPEADGTFRVSGITPGLWSLDIRSPGFAPRTIAGLTIEGRDGLDLGDIVMTPGAVLAGEVLNAAGEPVAFAQGTVLRELEPFSTFTTAGDGTFVTDDLVPGEPVSITIAAPSYATFERAGLKPPMEDLIITLSPSSSIRGVVIEKGSEDPLVDFSVSISKTQSGSAGGAQMTMLAQGPEHSFHSEDGTFTLNDVDPGKVNLTASAPGYKDATLRDLVVPEGADLEEVVLELEKGALVSGTVFDDAGRALPGVKVSRQDGRRRSMMIGMGGSDARTDGDGAFVLDGLDRAEMTLAFELRGFETTRRDVDTSSSDVEGLRVTMSRGAELSGIVYRETDGSPVAGATVSAAAAGGRRRASNHSDTTASDGSFTMEGVSEGRYTVTAQASGLTTESVENVVVTEGTSPPPIEIALGGGVTILGTVVGLQESELPSLTVQAMEAGGGFSVTAPVDGAGRFEVQGMNPGSVSLYASTGFMGGRSVSKTIDIPEGVSVHEVTLEFPEGHTVDGFVRLAGDPVDGVTVIFKNRSTPANVSGMTDVSGHYVVTNVENGDYDVSVFEFSYDTQTSVDSDGQFNIDLPTATISGHVTDKDSGTPLSGVKVTAEGDGQSRSTLTSSGDGYYELSGLQNGPYTLTALKNGYATEEKTLSSLTGSRVVDFSLYAGEVFSFQAQDLLSGTTPPELTAMVPGHFGPEQIQPNASGVFNISLQRGFHKLVLGGVNFATKIIDIDVPGNGGMIKMEPGAELTILVDGLEGNVSAPGKLLVSPGEPYWVYVTSDPTFWIGRSGKRIRVMPGIYTLSVTMPGEAQPHQVSVTVPAQNTVQLP